MSEIAEHLAPVSTISSIEGVGSYFAHMPYQVSNGWLEVSGSVAGANAFSIALSLRPRFQSGTNIIGDLNGHVRSLFVLEVVPQLS